MLAATGIRAAFWLYTFRFIDVNSNPLGDGLEGMAIFPFGFYCAPAGKAMMRALDLALALAIAFLDGAHADQASTRSSRASEAATGEQQDCRKRLRPIESSMLLFVLLLLVRRFLAYVDLQSGALVVAFRMLSTLVFLLMRASSLMLFFLMRTGFILVLFLLRLLSFVLSLHLVPRA